MAPIDSNASGSEARRKGTRISGPALVLLATMVAVILGLLDPSRSKSSDPLVVPAATPTAVRAPVSTPQVRGSVPLTPFVPSHSYTLPTLHLPPGVTAPPTSAPLDPCRRPDLPPAPANGTELGTRDREGNGVLEITNGSSKDAEVKLVTKDTSPRAVLDVYVRAFESFTVDAISSGTYRLAFASGRGWDADASRFLCDRTAKQFDEEFDFSEDTTPTGTVYHRWRVTLQAVPDGNASASQLDPNKFDRF